MAKGFHPTRSEIIGVIGLAMGLIDLGVQGWHPPAPVSEAILALGLALILVALCMLPSMAWRFSRRPEPSTVVVTTAERPAPDFRAAIRAADDMLTHEHGDQGLVDGWINAVYDRLFEWNVAIAHQFRPTQMVPTRESVERRSTWRRSANAPKPPLADILARLNTPGLLGVSEPSPPSLEYDPELLRLRTYRDRLLELVPQ